MQYEGMLPPVRSPSSNTPPFANTQTHKMSSASGGIYPVSAGHSRYAFSDNETHKNRGHGSGGSLMSKNRVLAQAESFIASQKVGGDLYRYPKGAKSSIKKKKIWIPNGPMRRNDGIVGNPKLYF